MSKTVNQIGDLHIFHHLYRKLLRISYIIKFMCTDPNGNLPQKPPGLARKVSDSLMSQG